MFPLLPVRCLMVLCLPALLSIGNWGAATCSGLVPANAANLGPLLQDQSAATAAIEDRSVPGSDSAQSRPLKLIAHRGGIVDKTRIENNVDAIEEAIRRNYDMLEVDVRESLDGQLVVHHDANFRRFYSDGRAVADMNWEDIQSLRAEPSDRAPLSFSQFAALCRGRIKLMIDTKGPDHPPAFFEQMEQILNENQLLDSAFIIGTEQSKQHFLGKAKIGINLTQLQAKIAAGEEVARHYVVFAHGKDLTDEAVALANSHQVAVVPSINIFHYPLGSHLAAAAADLLRLRNLGVTYFQIDSVYDPLLRDVLVAPQIDGDMSDWSRADLAQVDPLDDATGAFDLGEVSARVVGSQVFLRFDMGRALNLQSGPEEHGTLVLQVELPDGRTLKLDFRNRSAVVVAPGIEPVAMPWSELDFVCLPTCAAKEFELRVDLAQLGVKSGDLLQLNFAGSDALELPILAVVNGATPEFANLPTTARPADSIRIASMNTLHSGLADPQRQGVFKELVEFTSADIYCFNEEWAEDLFATGLSAMFPGQEVRSVWNNGCAVASRHPLERLDVELESAVAVAARRPNVDPLVIISVHFRCCGFDGSPEDQIRMEEAAFVVEAIRKIRSGACGADLVAAGIVVLGDYNLVGSRRPLEIIEQAGMAASLLRSPVDGSAATWRAVSPADTFWPGRLDYVTYSANHLAVKGGYVLTNRELAKLKSVSNVPALVSDHAMLVIDVAPTMPRTVER